MEVIMSLQEFLPIPTDVYSPVLKKKITVQKPQEEALEDREGELVDDEVGEINLDEDDIEDDDYKDEEAEEISEKDEESEVEASPKTPQTPEAKEGEAKEGEAKEEEIGFRDYKGGAKGADAEYYMRAPGISPKKFEPVKEIGKRDIDLTDLNREHLTNILTILCKITKKPEPAIDDSYENKDIRGMIKTLRDLVDKNPIEILTELAYPYDIEIDARSVKFLYPLINAMATPLFTLPVPEYAVELLNKALSDEVETRVGERPAEHIDPMFRKDIKHEAESDKIKGLSEDQKQVLNKEYGNLRELSRFIAVGLVVADIENNYHAVDATIRTFYARAEKVLYQSLLTGMSFNFSFFIRRMVKSSIKYIIELAKKNITDVNEKDEENAKRFIMGDSIKLREISKSLQLIKNLQNPMKKQDRIEFINVLRATANRYAKYTYNNTEMMIKKSTVHLKGVALYEIPLNIKRGMTDTSTQKAIRDYKKKLIKNAKKFVRNFVSLAAEKYDDNDMVLRHILTMAIICNQTTSVITNVKASILSGELTAKIAIKMPMDQCMYPELNLLNIHKMSPKRALENIFETVSYNISIIRDLKSVAVLKPINIPFFKFDKLCPNVGTVGDVVIIPYGKDKNYCFDRTTFLDIMKNRKVNPYTNERFPEKLYKRFHK